MLQIWWLIVKAKHLKTHTHNPPLRIISLLHYYLCLMKLNNSESWLSLHFIRHLKCFSHHNFLPPASYCFRFSLFLICHGGRLGDYEDFLLLRFSCSMLFCVLCYVLNFIIFQGNFSVHIVSPLMAQWIYGHL